VEDYYGVMMAIFKFQWQRLNVSSTNGAVSSEEEQ